MKTLRTILTALVLAGVAGSAWAQPETAFTYQGRLDNTNGPENGRFDFIFSLYDNAGEQVGESQTNLAVVVADGYFAQVLDFGPNSFKRVLVPPRLFVGPGEWLEIKVRTNAYKSAYQTLSPRQRLTAAPYASTVTGALPSSALRGNYYEQVTFGNPTNVFLGSYYGDGSNLTNLNSSEVWKLTGNAGTTPGSQFLGTTDNQPLELRVNGGRALRLQPGTSSPSLVAGYPGNSVGASVSGAVIAGGGSASGENQVTAGYGTVGGGSGNVVEGLWATVGGGRDNSAATNYAVVAGGYDNAALSTYASVGGGSGNRASDSYATVPGGYNNRANGNSSFAAGRNATANHDYSFIWNGGAASVTTSNAGSFVVYALGGARFFTGTSGFWTDADMSCATLTIRGGADLAEPFAFSEAAVPVGAVVVIDPDHPGRLKLSTQAYDRKVAGIVSGAGGVQPGISMVQEGQLEGGRNVALSGRVFALVDAAWAPVQPGDLLTSSDTPGHAMKAVEPNQAQGAILGKAMSSLPSGRGLVLVLVSLQ